MEAEEITVSTTTVQITDQVTTQVLTSGRKIVWQCQTCTRECVQIRSESRCLCGHRFKEHTDTEDAGRSCTAKNCTCGHFDYVFAQGSFILRCRCKHKHIEHCPVTKSCRRCESCEKFDSPFVCNCDHGWASHRQVEIVTESRSNGGEPLESLQAVLNEAVRDINRWDLVERGE